jgi:hypothetical protein
VAPAAVVVLAHRPVDHPVDHTGVGRLALVGLGVPRAVVASLALLGGRSLRERDALAVRAPLEGLDAADDPGDPSGLAAVGREDPELCSLVVPADAPERDAVAVGRVARLEVPPLDGGEPPRFPLCRVRRRDVDRRLVLLVAVGDRADERHLGPVRGEVRFAHPDQVAVVPGPDRFGSLVPAPIPVPGSLVGHAPTGERRSPEATGRGGRVPRATENHYRARGVVPANGTR